MSQILRSACVALCLCAFLLTVRFTLRFWEFPWPQPSLMVDGASYLKTADGATWSTLLAFDDVYHSPGYSLLLRFLFACLGSLEAVVHASKVLYLLLYAASLGLLFRIGSRCFPPEVVWPALALFSFSESWMYYCNMIQYEVLAGFLMLVLLLLLTEEGESRGGNLVRGVSLGIVLAALVLLHAKYAILLALPLAAGLLEGTGGGWKRLLRAQWPIYLVALAPLVAWSLFASLEKGDLVLLKTGNDFLFRLANNPNSLGYGFPHLPIGEPAGLKFIYTMPGRWLWLIGQRFLYLMGIKRDAWALYPDPYPEIGALSVPWLVSALFFFAGLVPALRQLRRGQGGATLRAVLLLLAAVLLPPLALFGSERFLVPVLPLMALFQANALVSFLAYFRNREAARLAG